MFMRKEDFETEFPQLWSRLKKEKQIQEGDYIYYYSGKGSGLYVRRLEIAGGSIATNYECNSSGIIAKMNKWVKTQASIKSKKQKKITKFVGE